MINKHLFIKLKTILILLFLTACSHLNELPEDDIIAYNVMSKFSKKMKQEGFHALGTTLSEEKKGELKGKINLLELLFKVDKELTMESGRKHAVFLAQEFINSINERSDLTKFLIENPITVNHIGIILIAKEPAACDNDFIRSVHVVNGFLNYYCNDISPPRHGLFYRETFEEAIQVLERSHKHQAQLVKAEKSNINLSAA